MGKILAALVKRLRISTAGGSYAIQRGKAILMAMAISLFNEILTYVRASPLTY
jgi:hypothetical protein